MSIWRQIRGQLLPGRLSGLETGRVHGSVECAHRAAGVRQRRLPVPGAAAGGLDERLAETGVHGPHELPDPHVGHLESLGGTRESSGFFDGIKQGDLAGTESDLGPVQDAEARLERGRHEHSGPEERKELLSCASYKPRRAWRCLSTATGELWCAWIAVCNKPPRQVYG